MNRKNFYVPNAFGRRADDEEEEKKKRPNLT